MIPLENKPLQTLYQIQLVLSKKISLPHDFPRFITLWIHESLCTTPSSNTLYLSYKKLMPLLTIVSSFNSRQKSCQVQRFSKRQVFLLYTGLKPMILALLLPRYLKFFTFRFFPFEIQKKRLKQKQVKETILRFALVLCQRWLISEIIKIIIISPALLWAKCLTSYFLIYEVKILSTIYLLLTKIENVTIIKIRQYM